jgi:two-component system response regulator
LLDLKMPRRDGLEVLAWMRSKEEFAKLPVIVLTSSRLDSDIARAQQYGIDAYFVKPSDVVAMTGIIKRIAELWKLPMGAAAVGAGGSSRQA